MAPLFVAGFSIVSGGEKLFRPIAERADGAWGWAGDAWDPFVLLKRAYCVSFDNAGIARIANNLAARADPYNEISAQICAKGGYKGEEEL